MKLKLKYWTLCIVLLFPMHSLIAHKPVFAKGDVAINLGVGYGSGIYSGYNYTSTFPTVSTSFEIGIADGVIESGVIGIGGFFGYNSYNEDHLTWGVDFQNYIIGAKGAYHYQFVKKLDTYTALILGYTISDPEPYGDYGSAGYDKNFGGFTYQWCVGGRYYLTDKFALMAEIGVGIVYLNAGIAIKI